MKKIFKRTLSAVLTAVILLTAIPFAGLQLKVNAMTISEFNSKIVAAQAKYPHGTNYDTYNWYIGNTWVGQECHGYARWLSYYVWGVDFFNGNGTGWSRLEATSSSSAASTIKPGDVVRYGLSSCNHTIFITSVSGDTVYYTDNNRIAKNTIAWNQYMSKSDLATILMKKLYNPNNEASSTGYGYIARYSGNPFTDVHVHSYTIRGYEAAHPHHVYVKCSCGDWHYLDEYTTMPGCPKCVAPSYSILSIGETSYTIGDTIMFTCDSDTADYYTIGIDINGTRILTKKVKHIFYYECEKAGSYSAYVSAVNSYGSIDSNKVSWTVYNSTTVKTNLNGGSGSTISKTIKYNEAFSLSGSGISKVGYNLAGWNVYRKSDNTWHCDNNINWKTESVINSKGYTKSCYSPNLNSHLDNSWINKSCSGTDTLTFYAIWNPNTLTVYYNANGGSTNSDTYKISSNLFYNISTNVQYSQAWKYNNKKENGLTNTSTLGLYKEGYTFLGWSTKTSGGTVLDQNDADIVPTDITSNINNGNCSVTLYAQWIPNSSIISYNAKGGTVSPASVEVKSGNSTTLPTPTKSFKITYNANGGSGAPSAQNISVPCKGWSTSSSATSASYSCGASYKPTANTTLYAVWNTPVSTTLSSAKPTKSGYTFLGWSTSTTTSQSYSSGGSISISDNVTLYAVWQQIPTYTITYNAKGGTVSPASVEVKSGNSTTLPTPTKSFKITYNANGGSGVPSVQSISVPCKGWSTSSTATSATYSCGANYIPTKNTTLYAIWDSSVSTTLSTVTPVCSGYKFLGWSTSSNAEKPDFNSGHSVNVKGNTTLFAVWELDNPTPISSDIISVRTKELNLDKEEITAGASTITIDERYLTSKFTIIIKCSSPNALILDTGGTAIEDSFVLYIDENGVCGTFKVYVRVYDSTQTTLYDEEYITVTVRDSIYYETIYLNYKETYQLKENKMEHSFESDDISIADVDASGKIYASGTGETFVVVFDEIDANIHIYKIKSSYTWWQWIIKIFLFGWIWY